MALRDSESCEMMNSDTKIFLEHKNNFVYPDAMILCNAEEYEGVKGAFTNPVVIIEVLSKSTASYDRGGKMRLYSQIPSLKYYILIEQSQAYIDVYSRENHTSLWSLEFITGLESNLELQLSETEKITIPLTRIYDRVVFEEEQ
jgi:Uma2 family endonuclease